MKIDATAQGSELKKSLKHFIEYNAAVLAKSNSIKYSNKVKSPAELCAIKFPQVYDTLFFLHNAENTYTAYDINNLTKNSESTKEFESALQEIANELLVYSPQNSDVPLSSTQSRVQYGIVHTLIILAQDILTNQLNKSKNESLNERLKTLAFEMKIDATLDKNKLTKLLNPDEISVTVKSLMQLPDNEMLDADKTMRIIDKAIKAKEAKIKDITTANARTISRMLGCSTTEKDKSKNSSTPTKEQLEKKIKSTLEKINVLLAQAISGVNEISGVNIILNTIKDNANIPSFASMQKILDNNSIKPSVDDNVLTADNPTNKPINVHMHTMNIYSKVYENLQQQLTLLADSELSLLLIMQGEENNLPHLAEQQKIKLTQLVDLREQYWDIKYSQCDICDISEMQDMIGKLSTLLAHQASTTTAVTPLINIKKAKTIAGEITLFKQKKKNINRTYTAGTALAVTGATYFKTAATISFILPHIGIPMLAFGLAILLINGLCHAIEKIIKNHKIQQIQKGPAAGTVLFKPKCV